MARDGSGTFTRVVTPPVNGDVANANDFNAEMDDIADALTDSVNIAGTKTFAADQSMGGNKLTDLAAPISNNDAARKKYVDDAITAAAQPLDATLTALAALSWSSGNALVQFTAADTVSLTLTPSVSSVTASQGAAATTPTGRFTNTTNAGLVLGLIVEGDRATMAAQDSVYMEFRLSDSAGNQDPFGRITSVATSVTSGAETGAMTFGLGVYGSIVNYLVLGPTALWPFTNDTIALGGATVSWADLFLASGAVINFNNGNFTLTHSSGLLSASGAIRARVPVSSETSGTLTVASANKKVVCSGNITIPNNVFAADDFILFDPGTSSRTFTRASTNMYVNGTNSASATLAANQMGTAHWRSATAVVLAGTFN
jgi:hypothetical protein